MTGQDQPFNLRADAFAGTAEYYARFRPPYPAAMLDDLRARAGTTGTGKLLDLGCGPGRVAIPLAPHFGEVWAVDPEPEMIEVGRDEARKAGVANIRWLTARAEDVTAPPGSFELVTMGESFHRLDGPRILALVLEWLKPGGCLAALGVKDSGKKGQAPWQKALAEVWARWSRPGVAAGHLTAPPPGVRYGEVMAAAGFEDLGDLFVSVPAVWTVEDLIGNAYSTSVMSRRALGERAGAFEEDLRRTLLAVEPGGRFAETLVFIATLVRGPR